MKTYKIKDLIKGLDAQTSLLFDSFLSPFYPTIEGNESNFLTDYAAAHGYYDKAFGVKYGNRQIDLESDTLSDAISEFRSIMSGVTLINLNNWARLYYALSLDYNPLYNVDGLTTHTYGATQNTDSYDIDKTTLNYAQKQDTTQYGETQDTTQYGATKETADYRATSETTDQHTNTDTAYSVAYDSATEKETGKSAHLMESLTNASLLHTDETSTIQHSDISSSIQHTDTMTQGAHIDTSTRDARTDTHSSIQHIDTELKQGNIGVTKSTDLLEAETLYRSKASFWSTVFRSLCNEGGVFYDYNTL